MANSTELVQGLVNEDGSIIVEDNTQDTTKGNADDDTSRTATESETENGGDGQFGQDSIPDLENAPCDDSGKQQEFPKPHSLWCHPHMSIIDIIVCFLFPYLLIDLFAIMKVSPRQIHHVAPAKKSASTGEESKDKTSEDSQKSISMLRASAVKVQNSQEGLNLKQWSKAVSTRDDVPGIVEAVWNVPIQHSILRDWNILSAQDEEDLPRAQPQLQSHLKVLIRCPTFTFTAKTQDKIAQQFKSANSEDAPVKDVMVLEASDMLKYLQFDLDDADHTPFWLYFHGGGLVLGDAKCSMLPKDAMILHQHQQKQLESAHGENKLRPIVTLSVDYRRAPEHVFPSTHIDGLSVIDAVRKEFLTKNPNTPLHVYGLSAGAYIAMTCTMALMQCEAEAAKACAKRITSLNGSVPMLSPTTNTLSYHMNRISCRSCPVGFLRWAWKAYLQLPNAGKEEEDGSFGMDSAMKAWKESPIYHNKTLRRLCDPLREGGVPFAALKDLPIFVSTNTADPLHDEGKELADQLRANGCAAVEYHEHRGSHCVGYAVDVNAEEDRLVSYSRTMFGHGK